jgi:hypothetical protein
MVSVRKAKRISDEKCLLKKTLRAGIFPEEEQCRKKSRITALKSIPET